MLTKNEPPRSEVITTNAAAPMLSMDKPLHIDADEMIRFTKQYLGYPYLYASSNPAKGFDCSGLLFHVFKHFNIKSPRASYDYEFVGKEVAVEDAQKGDLILFTGQSGGKTGHIGIITETKPQISFIHASSSRSGGVIISVLSGYYKQHFVKINRILK